MSMKTSSDTIGNRTVNIEDLRYVMPSVAGVSEVHNASNFRVKQYALHGPQPFRGTL
jgi:hypothetical protein